MDYLVPSYLPANSLTPAQSLPAVGYWPLGQSNFARQWNSSFILTFVNSLQPNASSLNPTLFYQQI